MAWDGCTTMCKQATGTTIFGRLLVFTVAAHRYTEFGLLYDYLLRKYVQHVPIHQFNATVLHASERTHRAAHPKTRNESCEIYTRVALGTATYTNRLALINSNVFASGKWNLGKIWPLF